MIARKIDRDPRFPGNGKLPRIVSEDESLLFPARLSVRCEIPTETREKRAARDDVVICICCTEPSNYC